MAKMVVDPAVEELVADSAVAAVGEELAVVELVVDSAVATVGEELVADSAVGTI